MPLNSKIHYGCKTAVVRVDGIVLPLPNHAAVLRHARMCSPCTPAPSPHHSPAVAAAFGACLSGLHLVKQDIVYVCLGNPLPQPPFHTPQTATSPRTPNAAYAYSTG